MPENKNVDKGVQKAQKPAKNGRFFDFPVDNYKDIHREFLCISIQ
jgi:hypothetical protein